MKELRANYSPIADVSIHASARAKPNRQQLLGLNSDIGELLLSEVNNGGLKALFAKILEAVCS